jgi:hypothetical protein
MLAKQIRPFGHTCSFLHQKLGRQFSAQLDKRPSHLVGIRGHDKEPETLRKQNTIVVRVSQ